MAYTAGKAPAHRIEEVGADHEAGPAFACLAMDGSHPPRMPLQEAVYVLTEAVYQGQWRHLHTITPPSKLTCMKHSPFMAIPSPSIAYPDFLEKGSGS